MLFSRIGRDVRDTSRFLLPLATVYLTACGMSFDDRDWVGAYMGTQRGDTMAVRLAKCESCLPKQQFDLTIKGKRRGIELSLEGWFIPANGVSPDTMIFFVRSVSRGGKPRMYGDEMKRFLKDNLSKEIAIEEIFPEQWYVMFGGKEQRVEFLAFPKSAADEAWLLSRQ